MTTPSARPVARTGTGRIASNLITLGTGQIVTWAVSAVYLVIVSRYLGPTRLGELTLAASTVAILGLLVNMGMGTLVTRTMARSTEEGGRVVVAAIVSRIVLFIPAITVLYVYVHVANLNSPTRTAAYVLAGGMLCGAVVGVLTAAFQGREFMSLVAAGSIVLNVLQLLLALILIYVRGGVPTFAAANTMVSLAVLLLSLMWSRGRLDLTVRVSISDLRNVVKGSLAFWGTSLFLTFYTYVDSVLLGLLAGNHPVGVYGAATRVFAVSLFMPTILASATLPRLSRLGASDAAEFLHAGRRTLQLLIVCALPIAIGLFVLAGPLVVILYGSSYSAAVPALMILALCIPFMFFNIQVANLLAACGQQRRWTIVLGVSCVLNPLFNLLLIPIGVTYSNNGAEGAAVALLITEVMMAGYGMAVASEILLHPTIGRTVLGVGFAAAVQAGILWLAHSHLVLLAEAVAGVAYVAIALGLKAVPIDDVRVFWDAALRKPRKSAA